MAGRTNTKERSRWVVESDCVFWTHEDHELGAGSRIFPMGFFALLRRPKETSVRLVYSSIHGVVIHFMRSEDLIYAWRLPWLHDDRELPAVVWDLGHHRIELLERSEE